MPPPRQLAALVRWYPSLIKWVQVPAPAPAFEVAVALILVLWGGWSVYPPTAVYATTPAFLGMRGIAPILVWGLLMVGVGVAWLIGIRGHYTRLRVWCGVLAAPIWTVLDVSLWFSPVPPPGAPITALYLLGTLWILAYNSRLIRPKRRPDWPAIPPTEAVTRHLSE